MSHPQNDNYNEAIHEQSFERSLGVSPIQLACDADLYSIHKDHTGEKLDREMTVEFAVRYDYETEVQNMLRNALLTS